jgi:hypothetical protein
MNERSVARQPFEGGRMNSGQPRSITRSQASSWLPRRATTRAGVSLGEAADEVDDLLRARAAIEVIPHEDQGVLGGELGEGREQLMDGIDVPRGYPRW